MKEKNKYYKDFKFILKSKDGKVLLEEVVRFGSKEKPFPKNWENSPVAQVALLDYKDEFIENNFDIKIEEHHG